MQIRLRQKNFRMEISPLRLVPNESWMNNKTDVNDYSI